eukprot:4065719-Alexandrium_andersonii.AAC.1
MMRGHAAHPHEVLQPAPTSRGTLVDDLAVQADAQDAQLADEAIARLGVGQDSGAATYASAC